jgi:thiamine kinase-like enzyme
MTDADALQAIRRIPGFERTPDAAAITRLGGLTNRVYRIEVDGDEPVVLRLPGPGTEAYIDREVEAANARAAARAGVSPPVLHVEPAAGMMLIRHVAGRTMTPDLFRSVPGAPTRAAQAFRTLHTSGERFAFRFELFAMIDDYLGVLARLGAELPPGYPAVVAEAESVRVALAAQPADLAPCHCDPLCENFIDTGSRMWLVDWEYSGMNDPIWDLGDLSVEAEFTNAQDRELLEAWCGGPPPPAIQGRMVAYKAMCDLLWTLWGLIQHANRNPAEDFWAYATRRFERCKALMARDDFANRIAALARG